MTEKEKEKHGGFYCSTCKLIYSSKVNDSTKCKCGKEGSPIEKIQNGFQKKLTRDYIFFNNYCFAGIARKSTNSVNYYRDRINKTLVSKDYLSDFDEILLEDLVILRHYAFMQDKKLKISITKK